MADINLDPTQVAAFTAELEKMGITGTKVADIIDMITKKAAQFGLLSEEASQAASAAFDKAKARIESLNLSIEALTTGSEESSEALNTVRNTMGALIALQTNFSAFDGLSAANGKSMTTMSESLGELTAKYGNLRNVLTYLPAGFKTMATSLAGGVAEFLKGASSAQQLENNFISLQAASGNLSDIYDAHNEVVSDLSAKVQQYGINLVNAAAATGESLRTTSEYASKLSAIPNVMNAMIQTTKDSKETTSALAATMLLAKGAGQGTEQVLHAMTSAYENLGNAQGPVSDNAQRGAGMFSLMVAASDKLKLRFSDTEGFLTTVAKEFRLVGDNTEGATKILERFSGSLQSTGLTAKQSVDVITTMVTSMNHLEMGTKSLLSARSGGPGGLQGAFQIESLIRNGKTDQVAGMLESSFKKQVGGKIYTQEEAANSPQAAAQFMRQRTMLQSSAFGGLAKDDQSATKLLEAMAKGPTETASAIQDVMTETQSLAQKGTNLQEKQVNVLQMINNATDRANVIANQTFLATARMAIGTEGSAEGRKQLLDFMETAKNNLRDNSGKVGTKEHEDKVTAKQSQMAATDLFARAPAVFKASVSFAGEAIKNKFGGRHGNDAFPVLSKTERAIAHDNPGDEKYMSLFKQPTMRQNTLAHAVANQQRQVPRRLTLPTIPEANKQNTNQAPFDININLKAEDGTSATVSVPQKRDGVRVSAQNADNGGYTEQ